jgi:hypothetical protein
MEMANQPKKIVWNDDTYLMTTGPVIKKHQAWLIDQL